MIDRACILFSGGTDSTAAAALLAEEGLDLDLLSFDRFGFHGIDHARRNATRLARRFPRRQIRHFILETTALAEHLAEHRRWRHLWRHGFFTLQNCGHCALCNHVAALAWCLRHGLAIVADGITYDWPFFPGHMDSVIELFRAMHGRFDVDYRTPVLHCDVQEPPRFIDKLDPEAVAPDPKGLETTGRILQSLGLAERANYKGTLLDKRSQARCFQFAIPNLFIYWVFDGPGRKEEYARRVSSYFEELVAESEELIRSWWGTGAPSPLLAFLDEEALAPLEDGFDGTEQPPGDP